MNDEVILTLLGYASGLGARDPGCADGPAALRAAGIDRYLTEQGIPATWGATLEPEPRAGESLRQTIEGLEERLANDVTAVLRRGDVPLVYGGDHCSAVGTWRGVAAARPGGRLGLLWVDAHMDAHTPETTHTGLIHGMPLAVLLGHLGSAGYRTAVLQPERVCIVGARSFEPEEAELLRRIGVRIYYMQEIHSRGLQAVLLEAQARILSASDLYGITIDTDSMDPRDAPGVGTPEPDGLSAGELIEAMRELVGIAAPVALEIAEFNPHRDRDGRTLRVLHELSLALAQGTVGSANTSRVAVSAPS